MAPPEMEGKMSSQMNENTKAVSHEEAREIVGRLIAGSFRRDGEYLGPSNRPRFSIPVRPDHDDDVRICDYIDQCKTAYPDLVAEIERLKTARDNCEAQFQAKVQEVLDGMNEIERLRGALEEICLTANRHNAVEVKRLAEIDHLARSALSPTEPARR